MDKSPGAFRTISEVADEINVPQHVLRFWESRFSQIHPMKRGGGRRYYRPDDVDLLRGVRHLLYGEGYTIRGVQRILREAGATFVQNVWRAGAEQPPPELADDSVGEDIAVAGERTEPNLAVFGLAGSRARERPDRDYSAVRREPVLPPAGGTASRHAIAAEGRRRLQSVLDDLIECRRLIDAALGESDPNGSNGRSAEI